MATLYIIIGYLALLLVLSLGAKYFFRGTSKDYFVASHSIGPFMLLMSVFGTTMTAFALVGSTGEAFERGVGTYGLMASASGLIHAACFFVIGLPLWAIGKRYGYVTQIQFFRARFQSDSLGYLLFPILVALVIPYLLIGLIGAQKVMLGVTGPKGPGTSGILPDLFAATNGAVPPWLTGLIICGVVLTYIFAGGSRAAAWANTFQTIVFMIMGLLAFYLISQKLGGLEAAIKGAKESHLVRTPAGDGKLGVPPLMFATYMFIPLSVGMFPHLFQHWLTARSAKSFRLTVVAHPLCIMIVWVPCVLIGLWATGKLPENTISGAVLARMVGMMVGDPIIVGLVTAGILAAIMSSLDSQFLCLGTMFTNDVVLHRSKREYGDGQILLIARGFIVGIVALTYILSLVLFKKNVFDLAVWSFTGFAALTPLVLAALYWRRATKEGAFACVLAVFGTWFYFFAKSGFGGDYHLGAGIMPVAVCWTAGALAMIVVSLLTKAPEEAHVEKFFRK
ncbi:MAG: sodium:solute symporter family protein [Verrucomicrobiales bacterium]